MHSTCLCYAFYDSSKTTSFTTDVHYMIGPKRPKSKVKGSSYEANFINFISA